jgi:predicted dehydrogenase
LVGVEWRISVYGPVGVDPVGIRAILAAAELAGQKGLGIVAGTQRRHQNSYTELMKRLHAGALGEIVAGEAYWNGPCRPPSE